MYTYRLIPVLSLFLASSAFAHIQMGTYSGLTDEGSSCSLQTIKKSYENGVHHPLNERVLVQVGTEQYVLSHPAVVKTDKAVVTFDHDVLQAVVAIKNGAKAMVLDMDHTPGKDGPAAFHQIENNWRESTTTFTHCRGLKFSQ